MAAIQQFAPINYAGMQTLSDPSAGFLRGLQMVQAYDQMAQDAEARKLQQAKMAADALKAQAEAERLAQYRADIESYNASPTVEGASALSVKYPEHREAYSGSWGMLSKAQQDQEFLSGTEAYNAIQNGRVDIAKERLTQQIQLTKDAGKPTKNLEAMLSALDSDPTKVAGQLGLVLSSVDPDRWAKMGKEQRDQALAPSKLAESEAMATIKTIEAQFAPDKYAEELKQDRANLAKTLKETELTDATRQKTLKEIAALDAKMKDIANGKIPVEDRAAMEIKLNDKFLKDTAGFLGVQEGYRKVASASPNAAGDLSLVFGYMKTLDPTSTVREGEQAQVFSARGIPDRIVGYYQKALTGAGLDDKTRAELKAEARKILEAAAIREKVVRKGMERTVKNFGLNPENVFYDRESPKEAPLPGQQDSALPAASTVWEIKDGKAVPAAATTGMKVVKGGL